LITESLRGYPLAQELEVEHGKGAASWFENRPTAHDLRRTLATGLAVRASITPAVT
jgi:hypothetical protein